MFAELLATYPIKVGGRGDTRILHAADPRAKANDKAREKYRKFVKNDRQKHERVMQALSTMLVHQRDKLQYLQMLEVWINSNGWEKWENLTEDKNDGRVDRVL